MVVAIVAVRITTHHLCTYYRTSVDIFTKRLHHLFTKSHKPPVIWAAGLFDNAVVFPVQPRCIGRGEVRWLGWPFHHVNTGVKRHMPVWQHDEQHCHVEMWDQARYVCRMEWSCHILLDDNQMCSSIGNKCIPCQDGIVTKSVHLTDSTLGFGIIFLPIHLQI